jgi:hypothetical protein
MYAKKHRLSSRLRRREEKVWCECIDYKIRHNFGECNETQNRNNENTQKKRPRITDGIKKEMFPS